MKTRPNYVKWYNPSELVSLDSNSLFPSPGVRSVSDADVPTVSANVGIRQTDGERKAAPGGEEAPFAPTYDAAGNQTKVKTATGIWNVTYNAENRPVRFTSEDGNTVIDCAYDYMGRRVSKKVTVNNSVTQHLHFIYRGYLQLGAYNALNGNFQWFILRDPTEPIATRPLAIRKDGAWYAYGIDLTKNVCELLAADGTIATRYDYTPFGQVIVTGTGSQPIQWSSEFNDEELGLIYYNYRHYNSKAGRWINRDPIAEDGGLNLYGFVQNNIVNKIDITGLYAELLCFRYEWVYRIKDESRFSSYCYLIEWTTDKKLCCDCRTLIDKLNRQKNELSWKNVARDLETCLANNNKNNTLIDVTGPMIANTGSHYKCNSKNKYGYGCPIPPGIYRILPGASNKFGHGTPGITGLSQTKPGKPVSNRGSVWIHGSGGNTYGQKETERERLWGV